MFAMYGAHARHASATDCTSQEFIRGEKVRKHAMLSPMSKGANRVPDRAHGMMSRDSTCRLCVTFLAMSARGTCACGVLERRRILGQPLAVSVLVIACNICRAPFTERVSRPLPAPGGPVARGRGPWRHSISQLVTGKDMSFVC